MHMNENRILPHGGQFQAVVNGVPTGLAGCTVTECPRVNCLRRDDTLAYRVNMAVPSVSDCRAFIARGS